MKYKTLAFGSLVLSPMTLQCVCLRFFFKLSICAADKRHTTKKIYAILDNNTIRVDCGRHKRDVEQRIIPFMTIN